MVESLLHTPVETCPDIAEILRKCVEEMTWAELDDQENPQISLQRAIGIECYRLIAVIKEDLGLSADKHLISCLEQIAVNPGTSEYGLTIDELHSRMELHHEDDVKELMKRYKEWDKSTLEIIANNPAILDKDGYSTLLDFLTYIVKHREYLKESAYPLVMKLLIQRDIKDVYEVVVEYTAKYNGENQLELPGMPASFDEFIKRNSNLRTPTTLRTLLLFILKNPRMVIAALLKITIGHPKYENTLIPPRDLSLLAPFFAIKTAKQETLFTETLRTVCLDIKELNTKRFMDLITTMLDHSTVNVDSLINRVFIPYLETDSFTVMNLNSILHAIRKLQTQTTKDTNTKGLIVSLAKRMSTMRRDRCLPRCLFNEISSQIVRILQYFLDEKGCRIGSECKKEIRKEIEPILEPVDKIHFGSIWYFPQRGINAIEVVQEYERRYLVAMDVLRQKAKLSETLKTFLATNSPMREDFLRHLILRTTEQEYQKLAGELTLVYWFVFGWNDELSAHNAFLRLTIDGCCLSLDHPSIGPPDLFTFLLKRAAWFCKTFARLEGMKDSEKAQRYIIENVNRLEKSITRTIYARPFTTFRTHVRNDLPRDPGQSLPDLLNLLEVFSNQCSELSRDEEAHEEAHEETGEAVTGFYTMHRLLSACLDFDSGQVYDCVTRMNELFSHVANQP